MRRGLPIGSGEVVRHRRRRSERAEIVDNDILDFPSRSGAREVPGNNPLLHRQHKLFHLESLVYRVADFLRLRSEIERDNDRVDRHKLLARLPCNGEVREYPGEQERDEALYAQESAEPLYDDFFHFATSFSNLVLLPCRM